MLKDCIQANHTNIILISILLYLVLNVNECFTKLLVMLITNIKTTYINHSERGPEKFVHDLHNLFIRDEIKHANRFFPQIQKVNFFLREAKFSSHQLNINRRRILLRIGEQELHMTYVPLDELVERADLISLHVPLLDSTRHIIGAEQIARMKPTACLVNTARGGLVDDAALLQALQEGRLAGAGLDCVEEEDSPATQGLLAASNVLVTPHIGGSTADLADAMIPTIAQIIQTLASGETPANVVNREYLTGGQ